MESKNYSNQKIKFGIISVIIVIILLFFLFFGNDELNIAFVDNKYLNDDWFENLNYREINSQLFGLEKWANIRYETVDDYSNYLTITTIYTLFLLDENEMFDKIEEIIDTIFESGIIIDKSSKVVGERFLRNGHKSLYSTFDGIDKSKIPSEQIKVIIEVWNCGIKRNTIICFGYSQISDNNHNNQNINIFYWEKMVGNLSGNFENQDSLGENALIYNIVCH